MDFKGQLKAQRIMQIILIGTAIISYIFAWLYQQISICTYSVIGAALVLIVVIGPEWPWSVTWSPRCLTPSFMYPSHFRHNTEEHKWVSKEVADKNIVNRINTLRVRDGLPPFIPVAAPTSPKVPPPIAVASGSSTTVAGKGTKPTRR